MARLTPFPPGFDPTIPSPEETPAFRFFVATREFLANQERASWDFSKQVNVRRFNEALTKAIHKDVDSVKTLFAIFWERLQPVSEAFESLYKYRRFLKDFEGFAEQCLSRNFESTTFQDYVRALNGWIDNYTTLLKRFKYFPTPMEWPQPEARTKLLAPSYPDNTNSILGVDALADPNMNLANAAIKNFQLANELYSEMQAKYLQPQFKQLAIWLAGSQCLLHIRRDFETGQEALYGRISRQQQFHEDDIQQLQFMRDMNMYKTTNKEFRLEDAVKDSIVAVKDALVGHYEVVEMEHEFMLSVVLKVYDHALDVLEAFKELASSKYALGPDHDSNVTQERDDAIAAAEMWTIELEEEKEHLQTAKFLPHYLQDLPKLFAHIAQFSFINCGDLHDSDFCSEWSFVPSNSKP